MVYSGHKMTHIRTILTQFGSFWLAPDRHPYTSSNSDDCIIDVTQGREYNSRRNVCDYTWNWADANGDIIDLIWVILIGCCHSDTPSYISIGAPCVTPASMYRLLPVLMLIDSANGSKVDDASFIQSLWVSEACFEASLKDISLR